MIIRLFKAIYFSMTTLLKAQDQLKAKCAQGHLMQKQWKSCPVCQIIQTRKVVNNQLEGARAALRIRDGKSDHKTVLLRPGVYTVGNHSGCDLVITPRKPLSDNNFTTAELVVSNDTMHIQTHPDSEPFMVNTEEYKSTALFDRDRLAILGGDLEVLFLRG